MSVNFGFSNIKNLWYKLIESVEGQHSPVIYF